MPELNFDLKLNNKVSSFEVQFQQLWWRTKLFTKREPQVIVSRFLSAVFFGVLSVTLWWQVNSLTYIDIKSMIGGMFVIVTIHFMSTYYATINIFQQERPVFLREQAN